MKYLSILFVAAVSVLLVVSCGGDKSAETQQTGQHQGESMHHDADSMHQHSGEEHGAVHEGGKMSVSQLSMKSDPVCNMKLTDNSVHSTMNYKGNTYGFCSDHCAEQFKASPEKYAAEM